MMKIKQLYIVIWTLFYNTLESLSLEQSKALEHVLEDWSFNENVIYEDFNDADENRVERHVEAITENILYHVVKRLHKPQWRSNGKPWKTIIPRLKKKLQKFLTKKKNHKNEGFQDHSIKKHT